jgi:dTDP-4-dehydrorhamnose reductase
MLGSALVPALVRAGHEVHATDLRIPEREPWPELTAQRPRMGQLDVRSSGQIAAWFATVKPEFVMHLAAETDVDLCQEQPQHAFATNALGTKHVALACQAADVRMVYISTVGVFDGEKTDPYTEFDEPNPINHYGRSKLAGERYVQWFVRRFYIVRAGWMVGGGDKDHKFVGKILQQLRDGATRLHAVSDRGTPTYAPDFADCLTQLIETDSFGLYHMACRGLGSRYDVARKILDVLGRTDVELIKVDREFFRTTYPAPRPKSEMMHNLTLEAQGWNTMRPWEEALEEYLGNAFGGLPLSAREAILA